MEEMQRDNTTDNIHIIDWRVFNFSSCISNEGERLNSPISMAGNLFDTRWALVIYPKGKEDPDFLGFYLHRGEDENAGPEMLHIENEFSLVAFDGVQTFKRTIDSEFKINISCGFPKYVKLEDVFRLKEFLLPSDTLTLRCKLKLLPPQEQQLSHHVFKTHFPTQTISASLRLDNFRSISKKDPRVLPIGESKALLSLKVSMNEDKASAEQAKQGTIGSKNPKTKETFLHMAMVKKKSNDPVHVACWVKLLDSKSDIAVEKKVSHLFPKTDEDQEWTLPYFIDTNNLGYDCIENDALCLDFDFTICDSQPKSLQTAALASLEPEGDPKETTLMGDLVDLYETKMFSDVTLRVGDKLFSAHKSVLAARSMVFDEIFTHMMKKSTDCGNRFTEIADVDGQTMELLLKFAYTDQLEDINDERCLLLYSAAQKYEISSLRFKCARLLRNNLSVKAVYRTVLLAEEFGDSELKMVAFDFFLRHYEYVLLTPEWQTFTEEHRELANQVMRQIRVTKQQQSEG